MVTRRWRLNSCDVTSPHGRLMYTVDGTDNINPTVAFSMFPWQHGSQNNGDHRFSDPKSDLPAEICGR